MKKYLIPFVILIMLTSCTLERRHYMNGCNVHWIEKNNVKQNNASGNLDNSDTKENYKLSASINDSIPLGIQTTPPLNYIPETSAGSGDLNNTNNSTAKKEVAKVKIAKKGSLYNQTEKVAINKKSDTKSKARTSLILGMIAMTFVLLTALIFYGLAANIIVDLLAVAAVLFCLIFLAVAGVLGIISTLKSMSALKTMRDKPEESTNKKEAITGLVFGAFSALLFLGLLFGLFLLLV